MLKSPLVLVCAAAALAAGATPAAAKTAKFTASYDGTLQTDWDQPRYQWGTATCFEVPWKKASGSETWEVKSRGKAQKLVVSSSRSGLTWRAGTHSLDNDPDEFLAGGLITRSLDETSGWDAGPCADEPSGIHPPRKNDCGTLLPSYALRFSAPHNAKFGLTVWPLPASTARNEKQHYGNCTLIQEDSLTAGAWPGSEHPAKVDRRKLFGRSKTVTIKGDESWSQVLNEGRPGRLTTRTTLKWRLVLRRVR